MRSSISDDREAAVVRQLEPFVAVRCPTVRVIDAFSQGSQSSGCLSPQTEGTVVVNPRAAFVTDRADLLERIACSRIDLSSLADHERWRRRAGQRALERLSPHPAKIIGFDDPYSA